MLCKHGKPFCSWCEGEAVAAASYAAKQGKQLFINRDWGYQAEKAAISAYNFEKNKIEINDTNQINILDILNKKNK